MKISQILILLFLFISANSNATTYYVDATNGNDSSNGTSELSAWQTIEAINDHMSTFNAGDEILFKRGETWKGERVYIEKISGENGANIIFGAYGNGTKPIITSVITQPHSWTNTGGNIWRANNPPEEHPERLLVDGLEKLRANIEDELDGINFFWYYDINVGDLYLYSIADPNNSSIEYSTDFPMIIGGASYITVQDLDIQGGWTGIFINTLSKNIHLNNLDIGRYCSNGIVINTGSISPAEFPENILVENCNFDAYFTLDYSSAGEYTGSFDRGVGDGIRAEALMAGEIKNCYFKNWGHASFSLNSDGPIKVSNVSVHDNFMTSPDISYGGRLNVEDANYNEFFNNQIINTSVQSQMAGQFNHYHHNIFAGTKNTPLLSNEHGVGISISGYANTTINDNIYENNIILNTEGAGIQISGNNEHDVFDNIIRNNIVFNCGTTVENKGIDVEINEFEATYDNSFLNNLVYNSATTQTCNFRGTSYDISGFNAITGSDGYVMSNNVFDNPLFVDAPNGDYHLQANSPAIDAGTTTLSTLDFTGNIIPFGTAPDIGVYEYSISTGTDNLTTISDINIYPNPFADEIILDGGFANYEIKILDEAGILIADYTGASSPLVIDLNTLKAGLYFVSMQNKFSERLSVYKIIKE